MVTLARRGLALGQKKGASLIGAVTAAESLLMPGLKERGHDLKFSKCYPMYVIRRWCAAKRASPRSERWFEMMRGGRQARKRMSDR